MTATRKFGVYSYKAIELFYRKGCMSLAKGAAFSAFLALFPVLSTLATLLFRFRVESVGKVLSGFMAGVLPPGTEALVLDRFVSTGSRPALLLIGATLISIYAASGLMLTLMEAFDRLYSLPGGRPFFKQRWYAAMLVVGSAAPAVLASALVLFGARAQRYLFLEVRNLPDAAEISTWLVVLGNVVVYGVALGAVVLVTGLLYHIGPNRKQSWRNVWPGAWLATGLWLAVTVLFGWYVRHIGNYNVMYGSIGAVMALLVWMYLLAVIAVYGCAFNVVLEGRR
jgi:membrane protein